MAIDNAEYEAAERAFVTALELLELAGEGHASARLSGRIAYVEALTGRSGEGLERLERAFAAVADDVPDADVAELASRLGQAYAFSGEIERAVEPTELALSVAQALRLPQALFRAMGAKALLARAGGRPEEELAFHRHTIRYALEQSLPQQAAVGYGNLSDACFLGDRYGEALEVLGESLALARRTGNRRNELYALSEMSYARTMAGDWEEALAAYDELPEEQLRMSGLFASPLTGVLEIYLHRGRLDEAQELLSYFDYLERSIELQDRSIHAAAQAAVFYATGSHREALEAGREAAVVASTQGAGQQAVKQGLVWAVEAALTLGEGKRADELLTMVEELPPGLRPPFLEAQAHRFRARLNDEEPGFKTAAAGFREYNFPFWLAVTQLEHGEWLASKGRANEAEPLLRGAREIFERLEARPWLERLDAVAATRTEVPA